jgi:hypothetical protein
MSDYRVMVRGEDGEAKVLYDPLPKQAALHSDTHPNILFGGAAGGSKSHGLRWHGILACLRRPNIHVLLLRRQLTDLKLSHLVKLVMEVPPEVATWRAQDKQLLFSNGSFVQFGYAKTREDFSQYLSSEWDMILVDEAGEFLVWMLEVLPSRLRTIQKGIIPQFVMASNPGGPAHLYLKGHAIDKEVFADVESGEYHPEEWSFISSKVQDNWHNNPQYVARLQRLPEKEKQAYLYGNWDSFVGQVFTEWRRDIHVCREEVPHGWFWAAGLDWGMRAPGWFGLIASGPDGDHLLRKELYFRNKTAFDVGVMVGHLCIPYPVQYIGADSQMWEERGTSSPTIAEEFQAGIQSVYGANAVAPMVVMITKPQGSRFASQQVCHRLLAWEADDDGTIHPWSRPKFRVHEDCKHFIRTIPALTHSTDPKKLEEVDTEGEDHPYDGWRYWAMSRPIGPDPTEDYIDEDAHPGLTKRGLRQKRMAEWERAQREGPYPGDMEEAEW